MNRVMKTISLVALFGALLAVSSCSFLLDVDECTSDSDCERFASAGESWTCNANACSLASVAECSEDSDCDDGESCEAGSCTDVANNTNNTNNTNNVNNVPDMGNDTGDMAQDEYVRIGCDEPPCRIRQSTEWTADNVYRLEDTMYVESGVVLSVARGTRIEADPGSALIIKRGAQLQARGTVNDPIVFTSSAEEGERLPGDWGGVALLGSAPTNEPNAQLEGIADVGEAGFGGSIADSSCGALEYVRIEFAGFPLALDKELNGLTLAGCGSGTIISHVQVHKGKDDGLEIFGGTVNVKNVVLTQAQDDSLDWDRGWTGKAQFLAIQQDTNGDNGFESDNWEDEKDASPRSAPQIYNFTIVGSKQGAGTGMTLKHGTAGEMSHGIVMGSRVGAIDVRGTETVAQATGGALTVRNTFFFDIGSGGMAFWPDESAMADDDDDGFDEQAFFEDAQYNNDTTEDPNLPSPFALDAPDMVPPANSPVVNVGNVSSDGFFDQSANYAGAFRPGTTPWTEGWTAFPAN